MRSTKSEKEMLILLEQEILKNEKSNIDEFGYVLSFSDYVLECYGLNDAANGEIVQMVENPEIKGMVINITQNVTSVVLLKQSNEIKFGNKLKTTGVIASVPVGDNLLGRIVDANGDPVDGKGPIATQKRRPIERVAPGVMSRQSVDQPVNTGILAVDAAIPIGKGQRELILGDRKTGKTQIAIDTIINQKGQDMICVYVAIGQKQSTISRLLSQLEKAGAMSYTTIVSAPSSDIYTLQYMAPYAGVTIAEEWMENGKDVLIIYDDLSKHAAAYRTLSLLLKRPPGREAYPGDVFYLHSRLLERAARLNAQNGGGSITALPIIETLAGDISAYIPTNVISITDGQLFVTSDLFFSGQRPAIDIGLSVSRVGGAAQHPLIKKLTGSFKLDYAQYIELKEFTTFNTDLDPATKRQLDHGNKVSEYLKQNANTPYSLPQIAVILTMVGKEYIDDVEYEDINDFKDYFLDKLSRSGPLVGTINATTVADPGTINQIDIFCQDTLKEYLDERKISIPQEEN